MTELNGKEVAPTAWHEAGHAVVAAVLEVPFLRVEVSPCPCGRPGCSTGQLVYREEGDPPEEIGWRSGMRKLTATLAGWTAQRVAGDPTRTSLLPPEEHGEGHDYHKARALAEQLEGASLHGETLTADDLMEIGAKDAATILSKNLRHVAEVAVALEERGTLTRAEVLALRPEKGTG